MQLKGKYDKGLRLLLCVSLVDKKGVTITNAFQKMLDESGRKPNKI